VSDYIVDAGTCRTFQISSDKEWLLTHDLGGFAMGTVCGANSRRYHGHLVAAIDPPALRMVLLSNIECEIEGEGSSIGLSCNTYAGAVHPEGYQFLEEFSVSTIARWKWRVGGMDLMKELVLHKDCNAVTVRYTNTGNKKFCLKLKPLVCHKFYHGNFRQDASYPDDIRLEEQQTVVEHEGISLYLIHPGAQRNVIEGWYYRFEYAREVDRGLDPRDDLFCPCELIYDLAPGASVSLVASDQPNVAPHEVWTEPEPTKSIKELLERAADKFFVQTESRTSILAGYPWFTDWGRDTMISLPGLFLCTGRYAEARQTILDYASQMRDGLIPNRFVERGEEPEYNTVDATLWFANAIYRTLEKEWDQPFAFKAMAALQEVFEHHTKGTRYNIHVDPSDGLLTQGEDGVQLTWMDAKIGDWVVTPRTGKPVEINGLWINALRVMEWLGTKLGQDVQPFVDAAEKAEASFEKVFWSPVLGYYIDVADPHDDALRPNQLIAMALPFSPVNPAHAGQALSVIERELMTPVGMRTLAPDCAGYDGRFKGPLTELDKAYHQGTVWPWLMGPFITAMVKYQGDRSEARKILKNARAMLSECGLGGITEVYDGDEPRSPGGCPWQAWSVAEWLRAWVEDAEGN